MSSAEYRDQIDYKWRISIIRRFLLTGKITFRRKKFSFTKETIYTREDDKLIKKGRKVIPPEQNGNGIFIC